MSPLIRRRGTLIGLGAWLAALSATASYAQAPAQQIVETNPWFVRVGFVPDYVLPTSDFLSGINAAGQPIRWSPDSTIEIGRQTDGSRRWHQLYNLPAYGVGFSLASFGNDREMGRPREAYVFFSWPIGRLIDDIELTTDFNTGVSWHWQPYSEPANPYNKVIGSNLNVRIEWGFYAHYPVTPRISVYGGVDFTHRSNGELLQPNDGVNAIGPRVALRYNLSDQHREAVHMILPPRPPFQPAWAVLVGGNVSQRNVLQQFNPIVRTNFRQLDLTAELQRHFYYYGKIEAGTDLTYDGASGAHVDPATSLLTRPDAAHRWTLGVYGGYEHLIARFGFLAQVGYVVARGFDDPGSLNLYERYAWRYRISDRLSGTVGMRLVNIFNATQIELGAVYRLH